MKYTFKEFQAEFPTDEACLDRIMQIQYGGKEISCPGCGADSKFHRITKRRAYACQHCGHHIYPCAGTIFEKSRTNLTHWFFAMYLFTSTRHGVAAKELERQIGCTYKTAWRMAHELRKLMAQADDHEPLVGHIEIDETHVGGKQSHHDRRRRGKHNKTVVFGMVQRGGPIRAGIVPDTRLATLEPVILRNVVRGSVVSTDGHVSYQSLSKSGPYEHGVVDHTAHEYVKGIHHVNTLEGHWARLKNSIKGTHVHVSQKHLWKYVAEFSYRRNTRTDHHAMFSYLVGALSRPRLKDA